MINHSKQGFVLVCVLWLLAILTVITVGFGRRAMMDRRAAVLTFDHVRAMYLARGAVERGVVELRNKARIDYYYEEEGYTGYDQNWAKPVDMFAKDSFFTLPEGDAVKEYEGEVCGYQIQDAESLISINATSDQVLAKIKAFKPTVVRKLVRRRGGSLDDHELPAPYQTIEEVRFLEGVTNEDWLGNPETDKIGLKDMLTCFGDGRININTASEAVLRCIPDLRPDVVDAIINYRKGSGEELNAPGNMAFRSMEEVPAKTRLGPEVMQALGPYCKTDSSCFTITGMATRRQGRIRASCSAVVAINGPIAYVLKWQEEPLGS